MYLSPLAENSVYMYVLSKRHARIDLDGVAQMITIKSIELFRGTGHVVLRGSTSLALWKRICSGVSVAFLNVWEVVFSCCDPEWFETVVSHDEQESCGQMDQGWGTGLLNAACGEWYPATTASGNDTFCLIAGKIPCYMLSAKFWAEVCTEKLAKLR